MITSLKHGIDVEIRRPGYKTVMINMLKFLEDKIACKDRLAMLGDGNSRKE